MAAQRLQAIRRHARDVDIEPLQGLTQLRAIQAELAAGSGLGGIAGPRSTRPQRHVARQRRLEVRQRHDTLPDVEGHRQVADRALAVEQLGNVYLHRHAEFRREGRACDGSRRWSGWLGDRLGRRCRRVGLARRRRRGERRLCNREQTGLGEQLEPLVEIDLGQRHMAIEQQRRLGRKRQRTGRYLVADRHLEVGDGHPLRRHVDAAVEGEPADDGGIERRLFLAGNGDEGGDEVGQESGGHREVARDPPGRPRSGPRAGEAELAAGELQLDRDVAALLGALPGLEVERQGNAVDGRSAGDGEGPLERAHRRLGLHLLGHGRLAGAGIGVAQRAANDLEPADRQMETGSRRTGRLGRTRAGREFPVGLSVGIGLEHDRRTKQDQRADLDPSLQQCQQRRPDDHAAHVQHLRALGAGGVGKMNLLRGNARHRVHRKFDRPIDDQLAPGGFLDGLDHGRLEGLHVDQIGCRTPGKRQHARDGCRPNADFRALTHGHDPDCNAQRRGRMRVRDTFPGL